MIIEKKFTIAGINHKTSKIKIDSLNWGIENKYYNVRVSIDSDKNLCFVEAEKPIWFANIFGLRETIPNINDVDEHYIEEYRPFYIGKLTKRVKQGWIELKKREPIKFISNCFVVIEH
jgi:hypothetical protein